MSDEIDVQVQDILTEMDPQTKMGFDLAHMKAINKQLVKKLAQYENAETLSAKAEG